MCKWKVNLMFSIWCEHSIKGVSKMATEWKDLPSRDGYPKNENHLLVCYKPVWVSFLLNKYCGSQWLQVSNFFQSNLMFNERKNPLMAWKHSSECKAAFTQQILMVNSDFVTVSDRRIVFFDDLLASYKSDSSPIVCIYTVNGKGTMTRKKNKSGRWLTADNKSALFSIPVFNLHSFWQAVLWQKGFYLSIFFWLYWLF